MKFMSNSNAGMRVLRVVAFLLELEWWVVGGSAAVGATMVARRQCLNGNGIDGHVLGADGVMVEC